MIKLEMSDSAFLLTIDTLITQAENDIRSAWEETRRGYTGVIEAAFTCGAAEQRLSLAHMLINAAGDMHTPTYIINRLDVADGMRRRLYSFLNTPHSVSKKAAV